MLGIARGSTDLSGILQLRCCKAKDALSSEMLLLDDEVEVLEPDCVEELKTEKFKAQSEKNANEKYYSKWRSAFYVCLF